MTEGTVCIRGDIIHHIGVDLECRNDLKSRNNLKSWNGLKNRNKNNERHVHELPIRKKEMNADWKRKWQICVKQQESLHKSNLNMLNKYSNRTIHVKSHKLVLTKDGQGVLNFGFKDGRL